MCLNLTDSFRSLAAPRTIYRQAVSDLGTALAGVEKVGGRLLHLPTQFAVESAATSYSGSLILALFATAPQRSRSAASNLASSSDVPPAGLT